MIELSAPPASPNPLLPAGREPSERTREEVLETVEEWVARIEEFHARIDDWFGRLAAVLGPASGLRRFEGSILQPDEPALARYHVELRMIPTRAVLLGRNRVSFVPSSRWLARGRGRINATTSLHQFPILDLGERPGEADWRLVVSKVLMTTIPFDEAVFRNLVLHQVAETA